MFSNEKTESGLEKFRYELKIPLDKSQYIEFMPSLKRLGLYPKKAFPDRQVSSVYFDSHELNDYVDNISGIANRRKTRIRWYNGDEKKLTLELKIKNNKASYKESLKLENFDKRNPRIFRDVQRIMEKYASSNESLMLQDVSPVLEVQYARKYFMLEKDLRMTIDVNQKFRRLYPVPSKDFIKSPVFCVAEFKFPAERRLAMQSVMKNIPFRVFRHSKYVIGMDTVAP